MSLDWSALNSKTASFRSLDLTQDSEKTIHEVVFAGLAVNLSEVIGSFPAGGGNSVTIFADTLVVDAASFNAAGVVVVARNLDVTALGGGAMPFRVPAAGGTTVLECFAGGTIGGPFQVTTDSSAPGENVFSIVTGLHPAQAVYFLVDGSGRATVEVKTGAPEIADLIARPRALNSLKASYAAASWLLSSGNDQDRTTAVSMLAWVTGCIRAAIGGNAAALPDEYGDLYYQAAALLVTASTPSGAYYVPVLSSALYQSQVNAMLDVLANYEAKLDTLNVQTNLAAAIQRGSSTLAGTTSDETGPLQAQLDSINTNIKALEDDIRQLCLQFDMQNSHASALYTLMIAKIQQQKIEQFLEAGFKAGLACASLSFQAMSFATAGEDDGDVESVVTSMLEAGTAAKDLIDAIPSDAPGNHELLTQATLLIEAQEQLIGSFQTSSLIWARAQGTGSTTDLPTTLSTSSMDPALAWDNFLSEAQAELTTIKEQIGDGTGAGPAQEAANQYLASLQILAQYGKAIDAKVIAYGAQMAQGTLTKAQIRAAQSVEARWNQLAAAAADDQERLAALRGVIQNRADAIKRSVYIAWTNYRDSYFYLYFQQPPVTISMEMNAAQLKDKFTAVSLWMARLLGDGPENDRIQLPATDVTLSFAFPIVKAADTANPAQNGALLTPGTSGQGATLTWTIPVGTDQLRGVLPDQGNVAIWITAAKFFLDGVAPNSRGNVIGSVSTSGSYQNGYGPKNAFRFVTKSLSGDYAYQLSGANVYVPWNIDPAVYSTPTPFTQWTFAFDPDGGDASTATQLRMEVRVAYRRKAIGVVSS